MATPSTFGRIAPAAFLRGHARLRTVINATLATLGIWFVAHVIGGVDLTTPQGEVGPIAVALTTLLVGFAGWGLLALLERRTARAWTIWRTIAIVVLVVSLLGPVGAETGSGRIVLSVMHAFTAAILITGFARTVGRPKYSDSRSGG